jgi:hypothetical protein
MANKYHAPYLNQESDPGTFQYKEGFLPQKDAKILSDVADKYKLGAEQLALLFSIRKQENGGPGREMGVLTPEAQRFKGNYDQSLRTQAEWAAGTIKKRFNGNVQQFADRWAPKGVANDPTNLNKNWAPAVNQFMSQMYTGGQQ